jgi:lysophospholipase L1-like esterase
VSGIRGRGDPGRSIRDRTAGLHSGNAYTATTDRPADARGTASIPRWLRAILFLPPSARPMAHPDRHVADATRRMAHSTRRSPLTALMSAVATGGADHIGAAALPIGRRSRRLDPRRWEVLAVLSLLLCAALLSVTGPIVGAGATRPTPSGDLAVVDTTPAPTEEPTTTVEPGDTPMPDPTLLPTPDPTAPPRVLPASRPAAKPPTVRKFVALGDSLTAWPAGDPWPNRLDAADSKLQLVNNAGVPGDTTAQMRARLASDVYAFHPDVLFVLGGTNDLGLGISNSATIANLRAIIVGAKAHNIAVLLMLVPPDNYTSMAPNIAALNTAIVNLARSQRVTYVDIHAPLTNSRGVYYPKYTSDGLHFSALGAQTVANTVRARIRLLGL